MHKIEGRRVIKKDVGSNVIYIPTEATQDEHPKNHPNCETGVISSWNDKYIFVRYFKYDRYGRARLPGSGEATDPNDLRWY